MRTNRPRHPASLPDDELRAQCELSKARTRGPGGQHRNKVESGVYLVHTPTGVEAHATERRSAAENERVALRRLRLVLAVEIRAAVPAGDAASALWRARVLPPKHQAPAPVDPLLPMLRTPAPGNRVVVNPEHHDYPALLAEALDVISDAGWDPKPAALRLDVSASQLLKLIKDHPPAWVRVNEERARRGMHTLK